MRFVPLSYVLLLFIVLAPIAQTNDLVTSHVLPGTDTWETGFDGQRAWNHVAVLASDSLAGRYSGFIGSDKADRYISTYFKRIGLKEPFGDDGYFHHFTYGAGEYSMPSSLIFHYDENVIDTAYMWQDFNIYKYSGFGKVKGRIVFAGYGISEPEKGWDEYENIDVSGAIVLAVREVPPVPDIKFTKERASGYKSTTALEKGAVGFILTHEEVPKYATITEKYYRAELPAVWISSIVADSLLSETGKTLKEWMEEIKTNGKPVSRSLGVEAELQVSGEYYPERPTRNIVGIIPGSDPELRHEAILIGAHMDHHGVDAAGNIYPGADDNASGTATMMELAQLFNQSPEKHKRSLIFAGFACEEEGLVGSKKLVEALPIGDYKVVTMFNMDMVGQGDGSTGVGGINEFPRLGESMFADWPDSVLSSLKFWGLGPGSDHASFRKTGIPSYTIGARGKHPNYHTPNDTAGAIKPEILKVVGEMVYHCTEVLADYPEPLASEVDKAKWLLHSNGGIEFIQIDTPFTPPYTTVKGVSYPVPVVFLSIRHSRDKVLELEDILKDLETARVIAHERSLPFMADSLHKDYEADSFTGMTVTLPANSLPHSSEALKGISRLGVSFVDLTKLFGVRSKINKKTRRKTEELAEKCLDIGVLPISSDIDCKVAIQVAEIWNNKLLYRIDTERFDWDKLKDLVNAGCFVLLYVGFENEMIDYPKLVSQIKKALTADYSDQFGIIATPVLVRSLLDNDVSDDDINNLLQNNLRVRLRKW